MSILSPGCYPMDVMTHHPYGQMASHPILPPPRSYYVVSWVPRALPEVVQLVKEIPNDVERCLINKHFELGMLVMRRCGVQNPEEIKCLLDGFREGTTRLSAKEHRHTEEHGANGEKSYGSNNCCNPAVERRKLLIFFNDHRASRPWVLCPAKHCIKSARTTGKVKGRVKIFQFDPRSNSVKLPKLFFNCLSDFMTRDQYVFATFCPQQKYTDHELDWFDLSHHQSEPGGDTIFRDLVEEHDTKGARMWPFEDYIIFSNSQSKIVAVFKKKQPLLTLYRQAAWPGIDDATITTTASSTAPGKFGRMTSCMTATTSSVGLGGTEFGKHGLEVDDECCTGDVTHEAGAQNETTLRRSTRGCRSQFDHSGRLEREDDLEQSDDADDDDSDFDISGKEGDRSGHKSGRPSRGRIDDFNSNPVPPPITSPAESHMQDSSEASPHVPPEYQFGFGSEAPLTELIVQAEQAENLLIHIMTRVLGQLEPLEGPAAHMSAGFGNEKKSPGAVSMKVEPQIPDCSDRGATTSENDADAPVTATTTAEGSGLEGEDGQSFSADGQIQRRKLDFAALGQELDNKRRKMIHYPSPSNAVLYHQLVRQFLSRLAFGLDHPPVPQKRIPDTVKRVVTKIVAESVREINLALLTSSIRCQGDSMILGEDGAAMHGMDNGCGQGFSFGSPAPSGNGAIVMSSRAGLYSPYDDSVRNDESAAFMQNYGTVDGNLPMCGNMVMTPVFPGSMNPAALCGLLPPHFDPNTMDPMAVIAAMQNGANPFLLNGMMGGDFPNGTLPREHQLLSSQMSTKEFQQGQMHYAHGSGIAMGGEVAVPEEDDAEDVSGLKQEGEMMQEKADENLAMTDDTLNINDARNDSQGPDTSLTELLSDQATDENSSYSDRPTPAEVNGGGDDAGHIENPSKRRKRSSTSLNSNQMEPVARPGRKRRLK